MDLEKLTPSELGLFTRAALEKFVCDIGADIEHAKTLPKDRLILFLYRQLKKKDTKPLPTFVYSSSSSLPPPFQTAWSD